MARRILLLRAVNVGGVTVPMAELKRLAADLGWEAPATLLASGNLVAGSDLPPGRMADQLEAALARQFGRPIDVIARSPAQWAALMAANPFREQSRRAPNRVMAVSLKAPAGAAALTALRALAADAERVEPTPGGDLYIWFAEGAGRSRLAQALGARTLGSPGTARNWNTVLKLAALVGLEPPAW